VIRDPENESKVAKFKTNLSIPTQICLTRNSKIQIHRNTRMRQDLNPNSSPCSSLTINGHAKNKEVYFLQQSWVRLVEMTESEEVKWKLLSLKT